MTRYAHFTAEQVFFKFNHADRRLNIELFCRDEPLERLRTFFGIMLIHCMTLIYMDKKLCELRGESTLLSPFGRDVKQEGQRQQEVLQHFTYPHGFLQSADLQLKVKGREARYTIGDLTLVDDFGQGQLYVIDNSDSDANNNRGDVILLYANTLARQQPKFIPSDENVKLLNEILAKTPRLDSYFSYDDTMSYEGAPDCNFNVSFHQRDNIGSFMAACEDKIKPPPTAQLGALSAMVVKKSYEDEGEDKNSSADGEKYIAHIEGTLENSEVFKNKIDGSNNKIVKDEIDWMLERQITVLDSERKLLREKVNKYNKQITTLNSKRHLLREQVKTSHIQILCGIGLWCCLFFWTKKESVALALITLKSYKLEVLQKLQNKLAIKDCDVKAAINEVIKDGSNSQSRLFERYGWKSFGFWAPKNTEHNSSRTAKLFRALRVKSAEEASLRRGAPAA